MQVHIESVSPVEKKLVVEVPWESVSQKLGNAYRELGKNVALKGFRKGKVPRPMLEQVYGPRIHSEVAYELVRESFIRANVEHKLAAVAEPRLEQADPIKKGQPFKFAAIVEVRGDIVPVNYEQLAIERRKLVVAEAAVDESLAQLRRAHTELHPIEGRDMTAPGDVLSLRISGTIGEHNVDLPQFAIDLDDKEREPLPGMCNALLGVPLATQDLDIEIQVPEDAKDESIRGRTAKLVVTILEGRAKNVPELDDEFAKDTGKADTLEGLRSAIRAQLESDQKEVIDREMREAALREVIKNNPIPVANSLIERAMEVQYARFLRMLEVQAGPTAPPLTDELRETMRPGCLAEVRGHLLLEALADKEAIKISDEELGEHIARTAAARRMAPAKLRAEWERDQRLESVLRSLRQEKVLRFLVDRASVTEVDQLTQQGTPVPEVDAAEAHEEEHVHGPDCDHDH
jgi:trigger factor